MGDSVNNQCGNSPDNRTYSYAPVSKEQILHPGLQTEISGKEQTNQ